MHEFASLALSNKGSKTRNWRGTIRGFRVYWYIRRDTLPRARCNDKWGFSGIRGIDASTLEAYRAYTLGKAHLFVLKREGYSWRLPLFESMC